MTRRFVPDYLLLGDRIVMGAFRATQPRDVEEALGQHFFQREPLPIIYDDLKHGIILATVTVKTLTPDQLEFTGSTWRKAPWWTATAFRIRRFLAEKGITDGQL